jgi:uncharacterized membrane protein (UPF0127 family)
MKKLRVINSTRTSLIGNSIRLADTEVTRIVGLFGQRRLPPGDGLLIVPSRGVHTFGVLFSIDVIVLDDDMNVVAVQRQVRPFRMIPAFADAAAVLEVPAGTIDSTGTVVGDVLELSPARGDHVGQRDRGVLDLDHENCRAIN